jgi:hypothetical protein
MLNDIKSRVLDHAEVALNGSQSESRHHRNMIFEGALIAVLARHPSNQGLLNISPEFFGAQYYSQHYDLRDATYTDSEFKMFFRYYWTMRVAAPLFTSTSKNQGHALRLLPRLVEATNVEYQYRYNMHDVKFRIKIFDIVMEESEEDDEVSCYDDDASSLNQLAAVQGQQSNASLAELLTAIMYQNFSTGEHTNSYEIFCPAFLEANDYILNAARGIFPSGMNAYGLVPVETRYHESFILYAQRNLALVLVVHVVVDVDNTLQVSALRFELRSLEAPSGHMPAMIPVFAQPFVDSFNQHVQEMIKQEEIFEELNACYWGIAEACLQQAPGFSDLITCDASASLTSLINTIRDDESYPGSYIYWQIFVQDHAAEEGFDDEDVNGARSPIPPFIS